MAGFIDILKEADSINIIRSCDNWQEAIRKCFEPLLKKKYISCGYIEKSITTGKELNFHYILGKGLAMPHAKRNFGVFKTGLSMLIIKNGVKFENHLNNTVYCLIGVAAADNDSHIEIMSDVLEIFGSDDDGVVVNNIRFFDEKEDIIKYLSDKKFNLKI